MTGFGGFLSDGEEFLAKYTNGVPAKEITASKTHATLAIDSKVARSYVPKKAKNAKI